MTIVMQSDLTDFEKESLYIARKETDDYFYYVGTDFTYGKARILEVRKGSPMSYCRQW